MLRIDYRDIPDDMPLPPIIVMWHERGMPALCCACVASTFFWQATRADAAPASNGARFTAGWILSRGHLPIISQPLWDGCPPRMNCELAAQIAPCWGGGCKTHRGPFLQSDLLVDLNRLDAALKQVVVMRCQHAGVLCPLPFTADPALGRPSGQPELGRVQQRSQSCVKTFSAIT